MSEDAGKKKFIKDFLQRVRIGEGFIEDIWIERVVKAPGHSGEGSTARSLSGRPINNITELLEDDLKHTFDDGYFTFRIVSALKGSGKTSLLTYLHELSKTKLTYRQLSVVSRFPFTKITSIGGSYDFSVKFYCYILGETFWKLLTDSGLVVGNLAKSILSEHLEQAELNQLIAASKLEIFRARFIKYFANNPIGLEEFFFTVLTEISQVEPRFTFAYLIDEFDALEKKPNEFQQALSFIRALIKEPAQKFESKLRLFVYLVGTSENIKSLFTEDPVIESLVGHQVANLNAGYGNEFDMIKNKINERIKGAFSGYKDFDKAWQEIQSIPSNPVQTLRGFCQEYATAVLAIYERYFKEEPEKVFEGDARNLVEARGKQEWQKYLTQKSYSLSSVSTTTVLEGHAFDCYVELLHNNGCVARCFGEAKNYELLSSHLATFTKWLDDVKFKPSHTDGSPPDLAFMIAPSCPPLLKRKLELKKIKFIEVDKVIPPNPPGNGSNGGNGTKKKPSSININTAKKELIVTALKGTGIKRTTVDKLILLRSSKRYKNLDDLASDLKLTPNTKGKLKKKFEDAQICFS